MNRQPLIQVAKQPVMPQKAYWFCWFLLPMIILAFTSIIAPAVANAKTLINDTLQDAIALRKQGKVYDSIAMLERLKAADELNVRVNLELAISYLKTRQYSQAEDAVDYIFGLAPASKDNKRLQKLKTMISLSQQKAMASEHMFKGEITAYRGYDEITSEFPYFEITEFDDYYQVERKDDKVKNKFDYFSTRFKGEYRYTPTESFNLFGQPTYSFWSNRLTYFQKQTDDVEKVRIGFTSLDTSFFVIQPKGWAFNAKIKGKWHTYQGHKSLTEQSVDINGSVLVYGARIKLGLRHKKDGLNLGYADETLSDSGYIYEQNTTIVSPYLKVSYRFSPSLLWSVGTRRRNLKANNSLLRGKVINYNSTLKYNVSDSFDLHLSYYHDDLSYEVFDLEQGLNSGELKRTFTLGAGYFINDNWQVGINALYVDKKQYDDFGQDQWQRLEGFIRYRF